MLIPIDKILVDHSCNVSRLGKPITAEDCEALAASIDRYGMFTPVCIKPIESERGHEYKLVLGYRRMVAHGILGRTEIEAFVRDCSDSEAKVLNAVENLQREGTSYWDECLLLREAFDPELGDTVIANELNLSRTWVRARWLVWRLPPDVIAQVEAGLLTVSHVTMLIHRRPEEQEATAARIIRGIKEGETAQHMQTEVSRRRSVRPKKELQAMMTTLMGMEKMEGVHILRWAAGEITDTQLLEIIK